MPRKSYLTTFEISQICEVNPTTVQNWVKEKKLRAFSTPGGHRRVRREDLIAFLKKFGMPIPQNLEAPLPYVLVVDDEIDVIELITSILHSGEEPVEVAGAQSGVEALLMIGERKPDLLVLDILMPGMDGIEVCEKLKAGEATGSLKIIAISGDHDPALGGRARAAGADLFLTKPLDVAMFQAECFNLIHLQ